MHRSIITVLLVAALPVLLLLFGHSSASSAAPLRLVCHDGDPQVVLKGVGAIPSDEATCDSVADGVCAFIVRVPVGPCGCAVKGCCQTTVSSEVPVRRKKRIPRRRFPSLVLRCLPRTPRACTNDTDCRAAGNPCVTDFCEAGMCRPRACVCITPDFTNTCSPEQAIHCPSPDCHGVIGDPCRHCDENSLCVTIPLCV